MSKVKVGAGILTIGVVAIASIGINIVQGVRRSKIRKNEKDTVLIIEKLIKIEDEREKKLNIIKDPDGNADKIIQLDKEISDLKEELKNKNKEISRLKTKFDKQITFSKVIKSMIESPLEN
jgi:predicted nuclease with TOPRIM domain